MNYQRIHDAIIDRARTRTLTGYVEKHHVIPRCLGGTNDSGNLVKLTAREHFIIHKLLCELYPDESKLVYAYWAMCNKQGSKRMIRNYKVSSREYERTKHMFSELSSKLHSGKVSWNRGLKTNKPSWNRGITHSDETKRKIGLKSKGRIISNETRAKMSNAHKGNIPTNKGISSPKFKCPHCYGMYDAGNLKQWHGDNCKTLKLSNNSL
jgi:hypothetical protein